jgi:hypothetical protein
MGDHSKTEASALSRVADGARWLIKNKAKVASALIVALPFVSRYVPGFPSEEALSILRVFLGA